MLDFIKLGLNLFTSNLPLPSIQGTRNNTFREHRWFKIPDFFQIEINIWVTNIVSFVDVYIIPWENYQNRFFFTPCLSEMRLYLGWSFRWDRKNRGPFLLPVRHDKDSSLLKGQAQSYTLQPSQTIMRSSHYKSISSGMLKKTWQTNICVHKRRRGGGIFTLNFVFCLVLLICGKLIFDFLMQYRFLFRSRYLLSVCNY